MKTHKLVILAVLALLACFSMGPGFALAQGEVILPEPGGNNSVTVSIIDTAGKDVTGSTWFPNPNPGGEVLIQVNHPSGFPIENVSIQFMSASTYPGT